MGSRNCFYREKLTFYEFSNQLEVTKFFGPPRTPPSKPLGPPMDPPPKILCPLRAPPKSRMKGGPQGGPPGPPMENPTNGNPVTHTHTCTQTHPPQSLIFVLSWTCKYLVTLNDEVVYACVSGRDHSHYLTGVSLTV